MKKKILTRIVAWLLLISLTFSLAGCEMIYQIIPELCPHTWTEVSVVDATCTTAGEKDLECSTCGEKKTESIPMLAHGYGAEWENDAENHWHDCSTCSLRKDSTAHTFETNQQGENVCSVCGYIKIEAKGAISFHFMMLGNDYAGDCVYIKAGENDILIDAGSRANSIDDIDNYIKQYVTDGKLEYVIVTHADQDHIAGFAKRDGSIFDLYECETIIDFPRTNKTTQTYNNYLLERADEVANGAKRYSALECYNNENGAQRVYDLTEDGNVKFEILYNYYYENNSDDENNYSVCVMFYHGSRQFLFTGDLEKEGEEYLAEKYDFTQVELYKAGHHGSRTSSNECLLSEIKPKICVACCCAGSVEYTSNLDRTFPTQDMINRIAPYTDKFYVPITIEIEQVKGAETPNDKSDDKYDNVGDYLLLNGNIQVVSDAEQGVYVNCSNNDTLLKDTEWFKEYRTMPNAWKSVS